MSSLEKFRRGFLYWYDYIESGIFRSSLNGSNPVQLVNTSAFGTVGESIFPIEQISS